MIRYIKLCNQCKYYKAPYTYAFSPVCVSPQRVSMVDYHNPRFADAARRDKNDCGPDAEWFVAKPVRRSLWQRIKAAL